MEGYFNINLTPRQITSFEYAPMGNDQYYCVMCKGVLVSINLFYVQITGRSYFFFIYEIYNLYLMAQ